MGKHAAHHSPGIFALLAAGLFVACGEGQPGFVQENTSRLIEVDEAGVLTRKPFTANGDRLPDFSFCGYWKNERPIPDVAAVVTVSPAGGATEADGSMAYPKGADSRARIQQAIDEVGGRRPDALGFRGAVQLEKGTYLVYGQLRINRTGVVLRGAGDGEDGTVLVFKKTSGTGIMIGHGGDPSRPTGRQTAISDDHVPAGATSLRVASASGLFMGDSIRIWKTPNQSWIDDLGMNRFSGSMKDKEPWTPKDFAIPHRRVITRIEGDTIHIDVPLPQSIAAAHGGGHVEQTDVSRVIQHCGLEHLRIVSDYDTSVTSTHGDAGRYFSDTKRNLRHGVQIGVRNGWVRNCTILHVAVHAVGISPAGMFCTVRDCRSLQPVSPIRGGYRYAFGINGSMNLVRNCYSEHGRHDFVQGARVTGPNVFLECVAENAYSISEPHHRWATGTLFDNVRVSGPGAALGALNRGNSGTGHGWAGANMVFWNCDAPAIVVFNPPTAENNFAIGYTGTMDGNHPTRLLEWANTRAGLTGKPDAGTYRGHALMGNGHIELPDRVAVPRSLFRQQLIQRIGSQRALDDIGEY